MRILILLLLSSVMTSAQVQVAVGTGRSQPDPKRFPNYHFHPNTPLFSEDFERATGYDMPGWGEVTLGSSPIINEDYTGTILRGTQSLLVDYPGDDQCFATNSFPAASHVWVSFMVRFTSLPTGIDSTIVRLEDSAGNCISKITINNDGNTFKVWPTCSSGFATGFGPSLNTTYTIWYEYNKNNGANSYAFLGYSTDGRKPRVGQSSVVEATGSINATDVSRIRIGNDDNPQDAIYIIDHLIIDDENIGNYP